MIALTSMSLVVSVIALLVTALAVWRRSRGWLTSALIAASGALGYGLVWARALEVHTPGTQIALGAGLAALVVLMIRFGLGPVIRQIDRH